MPNSPAGVMGVLAEYPRDVALSATPPERVSEPGAGYERQMVTALDWNDGAVEKAFGPAWEVWDVGYVALLDAFGDPIVWAGLDPPERVSVGQRFIAELRVLVRSDAE
jgi:hypothetical protein